DRGNGHEKSKRSRYQRLRDTSGDRSESVAMGLLNVAERIHDADHRAQQPDERSSGTDGGETAQAAFQFCENNSLCPLQRTLAGRNLIVRDFLGIWVSTKFQQT